jgi:uncharacterized RmlC-like cupin family protein
MAITNTGVTAQTSGSSALALQLIRISSDEPEPAHVHEAHETALYLLKGTLVVYHGDWLQEQSVVRPGEFFFLPAGAVHASAASIPPSPASPSARAATPTRARPPNPSPS